MYLSNIGGIDAVETDDCLAHSKCVNTKQLLMWVMGKNLTLPEASRAF